MACRGARQSVGEECWRWVLVTSVAVVATLPSSAFCNPVLSATHQPLQQWTEGSAAFDRRPYKNFLRFGRGNEPLLPPHIQNEYGKPLKVYDDLVESDDAAAIAMLDRSPLPDVWTDNRLAAAIAAANNRNFLRFGRGFADRNFIRFGRAGSPRLKNFLRFGRGGASEHSYPSFVDATENEQSRQHIGLKTHANGNLNAGEESTTNNARETSTTHQHGRSKRSVGSEHGRNKKETSQWPVTKTTAIKNTPRSKRAVPNLFAVINTPTSGNWLAEEGDMADFQYGDESTTEMMNDIENGSNILQDIQKRTFPRSFLRYGREPTDLHFIRFGKRGNEEAVGGGELGLTSDANFAALLGAMGDDTTGIIGNGGIDNYERIVRARNNKNFLRYG